MTRIRQYAPGTRERRETAKMWKDYVSGLSLEQIGAKYHYHPTSVWKRFKSQGLKLRPVGARKVAS